MIGCTVRDIPARNISRLAEEHTIETHRAIDDGVGIACVCMGDKITTTATLRKVAGCGNMA
jgi:hypothetical protein